jgi:hypothetical protein
MSVPTATDWPISVMLLVQIGNELSEGTVLTRFAGLCSKWNGFDARKDYNL